MNIYIKPDSPAPIWEYKPVPTFKTSLEQSRYWEDQKKLWLEGYEDIPGTLIYKTQMYEGKNRITGQSFRPKARFADLMVHQFLRDCKRDYVVSGIVKPRGYGFSTDMGAITQYYGRVYPGSKALITAKDQKAIGELFTNKIMYGINRMHPDMRPSQVNKNETQSKCYYKGAYLVKGEYGEEVAESEILCYETSEKPDSVTNFSGNGAIVGLYDEFPLHKRKEGLLRSSIECFMDPVTKQTTGHLIWGGTCEDTLTSQELAEFERLINMSELWNTRLLFIPFWWQMFLDEAGFPDKERAEEWWEIEYSKQLKKDDAGASARAFMKNNPRSLDDIFELASASMWEDDVAEIIKSQRKDVIHNPIAHRTGRIYVKDEQPVMNFGQGPFTVIEDPKPGIDYYTVVDGTATGVESAGVEGSNVAALTIKGFDPAGGSWMPVALYFERPKNIETSYFNIMYQSQHYDKYGGFKGIMAEANASTGDHFSTFLKAKGKGKWVMKRRDLSGKGYSKTDKPFQYVNDVVREFQIRCANIFIRNHSKALQLMPLLDQLLLPSNDNADIRDAWFMFFIIFPDVDKKSANRERKKITTQKIEYYRDSSGRVLSRWVDVTY